MVTRQIERECVVDLLEELDKLAEKATARPWKHDMGNWEIEGACPDRYPICPMHPDHRKPGFHFQAPNPSSEMDDADFIVSLVNAWPTLAARLRAAEKVCEAADEYAGNLGQYHYWRCEHLKPGPDFCVCGGKKTWDALESWRRAKGGGG